MNLQEKQVRDIKEKKKGWDGSEGKVKTDVHHSKESNEKKEKEACRFFFLHSFYLV